MAISAMGTLNHRAQRQPGPSVNTPPSSGPSTEDSPKTAPIMPMYLPRSRAGTTSAMMACESTIMPPPPMPWMARATMMIQMFGASAPTTEPTRYVLRAKMNSGLRPIWSPSLP